MVELYSKSLVRASGKVLLQLQPIKTFDCKQTAVLVVRINNIGQYKLRLNRLLTISLT